MLIDLYDEISLWSVRGIVAQLRSAPDAPVTLRINSPGGDVQEGFALASALRTHRGRKVAVVEGVCASAATFPACACDELHMHPESLLMIHNPWGGTAGDADDMESYADVLRKMTDLMVGMYQRKTGADEKTVRDWLSRDTWMTPQEAKDAGFCDAIVSSEATPSARANLRRFAAKLKLPPAQRKRITAMKDQLRNKLATHGLAEDDGNMMDAYLSYLAETEDGPEDRKAMAAAMEEEKQAAAAKAKAEDKHKEPDGDEGNAAMQAMSRRLSILEEKNEMLRGELSSTKNDLAEAKALVAETTDAKATGWAETQIAMGRIRGEHKGDVEKTTAWLAAKYKKDKADAEDLLDKEGTFKPSERIAMARYTHAGAGIDQPIPRADELQAVTSAKAIDRQMEQAITMQREKLKKAGKESKYDNCLAAVKQENPTLFAQWNGGN